MSSSSVSAACLLAVLAAGCGGGGGGDDDRDADGLDARDGPDARDDGSADRPDGEASREDGGTSCSGGCADPPGPCYEPAGACVDGSCVYSPLAAASACDDADPCTTGDACDGAGACVGESLDCSRPHTTGGHCADGSCTGFACAAGWGDCSGGWADGCETSLDTSPNCGSCGHSCSGREIWCVDRSCQARWLEIDVRDYIMVDTPGTKLCQSDLSCCHDGYEDIDGEWLLGTYCTSGMYMRDYLHRDTDAPYLYGVVKNSEYENFRCFTNPDSWCSSAADYPPQAVPLVMTLPILPARVVAETGGVDTGVTPGALLIPEYETWRAFDERGFNQADCTDIAFHGRIWQRNYSFLVDEVDFGGDVGTQRNVWVLESESSGTQPTAAWGGGERLERYWKTTEYGGVREMGAEDESCRASHGASTCDGVYRPQNITAFPRVVAEDYAIPPVCRGI